MVKRESGFVLLVVLVALMGVSLMAFSLSNATEEHLYWSAVRAQRIQVEQVVDLIFSDAPQLLSKHEASGDLSICDVLTPGELLERHRQELSDQPIFETFDHLETRVLIVDNCARLVEDNLWNQRVILVHIRAPSGLSHIWLGQFEERVW